MNNFSRNLKWLREMRKLGQIDLAGLLGVSRDNVASYERGSVPKLEVLLKIVNLFHVNLQEMVEKDFETHPPTHVSLAADEAEDYRSHEAESLTLASLQKLIRIQEKYIRSLEEKIEAGTKDKP